MFVQSLPLQTRVAWMPWDSCPGTDGWAVSNMAGGRGGGFSEAQAVPHMKMLGADCPQGCYGFWRPRRGSLKVGMVAAWGIPRPPPVGQVSVKARL